MENLKEIENLPPEQRSSRVDQQGVLWDLESMEITDAIAWLKNNISSPVTRAWGSVLYSLSVEWPVLEEWMHMEKIHALAALDAVDYYITEDEKWPPGSTIDAVVSEVGHVLSLYPTPRIQKIHDHVISFAKPTPLTKELAVAARILFGDNPPKVVLRERDLTAKWHSLLDKADRKHCLLIVDWKTPAEEIQDELSSLPIVQQTEDGLLTYQSIDIGCDSILTIALPSKDLAALQEVVPEWMRFGPTDLRPRGSTG